MADREMQGFPLGKAMKEAHKMKIGTNDADAALARLSADIYDPDCMAARNITVIRAELDQLRQRLGEADKWRRAWRNRFIDERMNAYPEASYEMKRCYAESDANDFEAAFTAAIDGSGHDSLPPHKEGGD